MAKEVSTIGVQLVTATESTAGTRPTTGYTNIAHVLEVPEYDNAPEGLEVTDLADLIMRRYIPGLIDPGDDIPINVNTTEEGITQWNSLAESAKTAYATGKRTWFAVIIPTFTNAFFFSGLPVKANFGGAAVNEVLTMNYHITPNDFEGWATKPTVASA